MDPSDGETERLTVEEARLAHVERLLERSTEAEETLAGDASLGDAAASAANALAEAARLDPRAEGLAERSRSLAAELAELARDVRAYREGLAADPARLQEIRERLSVLKGLQRKYGATEADVLAFLREASSRLSTLATADERLAELTEDAERADADLEVRGRRPHAGPDRRGAGAGGGARARAAAARDARRHDRGRARSGSRARAVGGRASSSSGSRRRRGRRRRRSPRRRRAASSRARCSRVAA